MRERLKRWLMISITFVIIGVTALSLGIWFFWPSTSGHADASDPQQVAQGMLVYRQHCASCHGFKLEGQPNWRTRRANGRLPAPPHDKTGHTWHHPDEHLFKLTKHGLRPPLAPKGYKSDMPAFADVLSDEQIWAVLAYIKSTWSTREKEFQERLNRMTQKAKE